MSLSQRQGDRSDKNDKKLGFYESDRGPIDDEWGPIDADMMPTRVRSMPT